MDPISTGNTGHALWGCEENKAKRLFKEPISQVTYLRWGPAGARAKVIIDRQGLFYSRADLTLALAQDTLRLRELRALCSHYCLFGAQRQVKGGQGSLSCGGTVGSWDVGVTLRMKNTSCFER